MSELVEALSWLLKDTYGVEKRLVYIKNTDRGTWRRGTWKFFQKWVGVGGGVS